MLVRSVCKDKGNLIRFHMTIRQAKDEADFEQVHAKRELR